MILQLLIIIGLIYLVNLSLIDCNNPVYPANLTRAIEIMKYCTGGEKEVP